MVALGVLVMALAPPLVPRTRSPLCATGGDDTYARFDASLASLKARLAGGESAAEAVGATLDSLDDMFIPTLASRIDAAPEGSEELPALLKLMGALRAQSLERFERARDQLQRLLGAGEINKLDAQLCALIREDELDAGFLYVLFKNMEDADAAGDEEKARLLSHIHTRTQEELEKRTEPALALLHKLTRTADAPLRGRILRHHLTPQTAITLPDTTKIALDTPKPAEVSPDAFAGAVDATLAKVLAMPLERALVKSTVEEVRAVAKEARAVVEEAYPPETLAAFTDALTPAFDRARELWAPPPPPSE